MALDDTDTENFLTNGNDVSPIRSRRELEAEAEGAAKIAFARRWEEFALLQAQHRAEMDKMTVAQMTMFGRTRPEVSVNAFALAKDEAGQYARLKAEEGETLPKDADIRAFDAKILNRDVAYYAEGRAKPSFIDDGKSIYVPDFHEDVALLASLQLAQQRWGVVKVKGTDDFKDRVVKLAAEYDLKLSNPDLAEKVMLMRTAEGVLSAPSAEERAAVAKVEADFKADAPLPPAAPAPEAVKAPETAPAPATAAKTPTPAPAVAQEAAKPVEAAPAAPAVKVAAPVEVQSAEPAAPDDTKDWIRKLQEERQLKKLAKEQEVTMAEAPGAKPEEAQESAVAATTAAPVDADFEEPEDEIDMGFDDDDFNPLATPTPAQAGVEKSQTVAARP